MILYDKKCFFPQFPGIDLTAFSIIKDYTNFQFNMISMTARIRNYKSEKDSRSISYLYLF